VDSFTVPPSPLLRQPTNLPAEDIVAAPFMYFYLYGVLLPVRGESSSDAAAGFYFILLGVIGC
jgi:hypothetical protein